MVECEVCGAKILEPIWSHEVWGYDDWWETLCPNCGSPVEWNEPCTDYGMMHPEIQKEEEDE